MAAQVTRVTPKVFKKLVDQVLEFNQTPRRFLYEYPYNSFESDAIIKKSENLVKSMVRIIDEE